MEERPSTAGIFIFSSFFLICWTGTHDSTGKRPSGFNSHARSISIADDVVMSTPTKANGRKLFGKNIVGDIFSSSPKYGETALAGMIMEVRALLYSAHLRSINAWLPFQLIHW